MLWRFLDFSKLLRGAGLRMRKRPRFSWPDASTSRDDEGVELPAVEGAQFSARFDGLLGDARLEMDLEGPEGLAILDEDFPDRRDNFVLGRKGVARGVCDCARIEFVVGACALFGLLKNCCEAMRRKEGDAGVGDCCDAVEVTERSEPCEALRERLNLDGEREIERRRVRTADCTSM